MHTIPVLVVAAALLLLLYTYGIYPAVLRLLRRFGPEQLLSDGVTDWPRITFSIPVYNEAIQARALLDSVLAIDYPADRRQILVVSDASSDGTDEIVSSYASRGVELVRLAQRSGKTAAEAVAADRATGDIIINTDASIRIHPAAIKRLVARFADPAVGVASGRDVSVSHADAEANEGEGGYVDYEMRIREAETNVHGIVGASGCLYAIRTTLHRRPLPAALSRDFASALHAEEAGYRAVAVSDALCYVPRTTSLSREYHRKVRTIERGMHTLWHKRALLNPLRHGLFAWMLFSHKVCRWLVPWAALAALLALALLAPRGPLAFILFVMALTTLLATSAAWFAAIRYPVGRPVRVLAFALMSNVAVLAATLRLLGGTHQAVWEPTRRETAQTASPDA